MLLLKPVKHCAEEADPTCSARFYWRPAPVNFYNTGYTYVPRISMAWVI